MTQGPLRRDQGVTAWDYRLPLVLTMAASVVLSLVSMHYSPILNRDGMMYIHLARLIGDGRLDSALALFDWPFFPALLAALKALLPLPLIHIAYGTSLLFAALTTWMLVVLMHRAVPTGNIWWAVLLALSLPATDQYRPDVLRDWPAWFFMLLSVWVYLRYSAGHAWRWALAFSVTVLVGALFRLEVAVIAAPLFLLSLFERGYGWRERIRLFALPLVAGVLLLGLLVIEGGRFSHRLWDYWNTVNPLVIYDGFRQSGDALADAVLNRFSRDYGAAILAVGLLVLIPTKLIHFLFGLLLPYALERRHGAIDGGPALRVYRWLAWTWLLLVTVFLLRNYYASSRYLVPLMLFLMPFLYLGLVRLRERTAHRGLWALLVFLIVLHGLSAAIATRGPEKLAIREAGTWAGEHLPADDRVYINNGQVNFYSGRPYFRGSSNKILAPQEVHSDWQVLAVRRADEAKTRQRLDNEYQLLERFDSEGSEVVLVFEKLAVNSQPAAQ
ncbi:hypothetical protein [Alloalcanivorax mobilis]|uniref:hypothetical protein n=1 Tax=Alloalcanivorax mobilis TaxID=2019569 RepID=UPI000C76C7C1|nr:hypothetical protein [Alloalcanivorax mobilis]